MAPRTRKTTTTTESMFLAPSAIISGKKGRKADADLAALLNAGIGAMGEAFALAATLDPSTTVPRYVVTTPTGDVKVSRAKVASWAKQNGRKVEAFGLDTTGNLVISFTRS